MGLLQELSRYLSAKYDDGSLAKENEQLTISERFGQAYRGAAREGSAVHQLR